ncbi:MAG: response regulator [Lachnospiraceae bacterium]|jgi:CheY-like chemotaxis protein|nr:response regulator [Lachnospiraceae bacterium]
MENETKCRYYLPSLMRTGFFDFRELAAKSSITGMELLDQLAHVLTQLPDVMRALPERELDDIPAFRDELHSIGCSSLVVKANAVLDASAKEAAFDEFSIALGEFLKQIVKLQNPPKWLLGQEGVHDPHYTELMKNRLSTVILGLDQDEENRKPIILTVDDASFMVNNITAMLSNTYKVYGFTKPSIVETFLAHVVPEMFLLDYKMPEISGFELVAKIREHPEHQETPVIFITGSNETESFKSAVKLSACDYIIKPFKEETLLNKVASHIVKKKTF